MERLIVTVMLRHQPCPTWVSYQWLRPSQPGTSAARDFPTCLWQQLPIWATPSPASSSLPHPFRGWSPHSRPLLSVCVCKGLFKTPCELAKVDILEWGLPFKPYSFGRGRNCPPVPEPVWGSSPCRPEHSPWPPRQLLISGENSPLSNVSTVRACDSHIKPHASERSPPPDLSWAVELLLALLLKPLKLQYLSMTISWK